MCEPVSIAAGVTAVASTAYSIYSNNQQAGAQANIAYRNQRISNQQAGDALARGNYAAGVQEIRGGQMAESAKLAYAGAGVDTSSGTASDAVNASQAMSNVDVQTVRNNATREAMGLKTQGDLYAEQAQLDLQRGAANNVGTLLTAGGQLVDAAGKGYGRYQQNKNAGL